MMTLIIKNDQDSKHGYIFINMLVKWCNWHYKASRLPLKVTKQGKFWKWQAMNVTKQCAKRLTLEF
jgi:hypothetical protein